MPKREYRIIVIGGGHAGVEAAWAAANILREPRSVALVTLDPSKIGVMSCNPALGGLAKGQLVREIDAMGGLMGLATDATGIQFKVLNRSKGPAVFGPRAQCDKHAYAEQVQRMIAARAEIEVIAGSVERLPIENGQVQGVLLSEPRPLGSGRRPVANGSTVAKNEVAKNEGEEKGTVEIEGAVERSLTVASLLRAPAVVLTTGTFMRGLMHCGEQKTEGGRFGEAPAVGISAALRELGFELGRLKTGTPPRLKRSTIRWDDLPAAMGDAVPVAFSDLSVNERDALAGQQSWNSKDSKNSKGDVEDERSRLLQIRRGGDLSCTSPPCHVVTPSLLPSMSRFPVLPQVDCRQTSTTASAHELIRANLHRAPMYSGQIESAGPRYCPSIEDKVVRFAERRSHGVFLEPESRRDDWVYCNGISTSLPPDVQDAIVRSMPGCEKAEIYRYGYAVEYDMVRPHQILATGMTKLVEGLFLAGQINGTSGYEEAAAQGLIAGINAARHVLKLSEFTLGRDEAYIGVLMDDLVTKTPVEPYRMFTSRAEHRLLLRADNTAERLTPIAERLGLLSGELGAQRLSWFAERSGAMRELHRLIDATRIDSVPLDKVMRQAGYEVEQFVAWVEKTDPALARRARSARALETVFADRVYAPYVERQRAEIKRHAELEHRKLPEHLDYRSLVHLRTEARNALDKFRPRTFGQAGRLEGITPADLTLLAVLVKRHALTSAQERGAVEPPPGLG